MHTDERGQAPRATHAKQKLTELRKILEDARQADDSERLHAGLIEILDGLITQAEDQARAIEALRSDLTHKQGIVTKIGGGDY